MPCDSATAATSDDPPRHLSIAALQPEAEPGIRANPDLFLFHCTYGEALLDFGGDYDRRAPGLAAMAANASKLVTTTILRDPIDRLVSEFHFGLDFELRGSWGTPAQWRRQFWGQADYTDAQLRRLQPKPADGTSRLERFAEQPWVAAHNRQARFLGSRRRGGQPASRGGRPVGTEPRPVAPMTRAALEDAKRNLASITVLGTVDDIPRYLCALATTLGNRVAAAAAIRTALHDNIGTRRRGGHSQRLKEAVYKHSWADFELFAYGRTLLERQWARFPECRAAR